MFDIGFTEILVIASIALIVVGPERLPGAVRTVSLWIGRLKRSLRETRRELEQQIGADDIRRELHNEEVMRSLNNIQHQVTDTLDKDLNLDDENHYPPGHHDRPHITDPKDAEDPPENSIAPPTNDRDPDEEDNSSDSSTSPPIDKQ